MIINSHQESKKYYFVTMGTDCHITMQAISPKDKVQFHFRFFLVYSLLRVAPLSPAPFSPQETDQPHPKRDHSSGESIGDPCHAGSYVQFYNGRDRTSPPLGPPLCGKSPPRPVLSTGNYLTLRLVTRGTQPRVDFVGDFTSFRLGKKDPSLVQAIYLFDFFTLVTNWLQDLQHSQLFAVSLEFTIVLFTIDAFSRHFYPERHTGGGLSIQFHWDSNPGPSAFKA